MQHHLEPLPVLYLIPHSENDNNSNGEGFKGTLLFLISHWMTEASGAFMMLNQLCCDASDLLKTHSHIQMALSNHEWGSIVKLLTPPLEYMFNPQRLKSSQESERRIKAYIHDFNSYQPPLEYPLKSSYQSSNSQPSNLVQFQRIYTTSSTSAFIAACKKKGISPASAIHSAYLAAVWQLSPKSDHNRPYASIMPAQMRKRLPQSSAYRDQGCWNSARLLFLTAPAGQDFITRALHLRKQYLLATWQYDDVDEMNIQTMNHFINTPNQSLSTPFITQIGLLDADTIKYDHGSITIDRVSVWADSLAKSIVLGQWTFRGYLNIQISWNIAFHGQDQVQDTVQEIHKILIHELGIKLEVEEDIKLTF